MWSHGLARNANHHPHSLDSEGAAAEKDRMKTRSSYRVAFATDLSPDSRPAFLHALRLALALESELHMLHVEGRGRHGSFPSVRETLERWGAIHTGAPREDVEALTGLHIGKVEIRDHDAVGGIAHFLSQHGCDLLVLATHAREGVERALKGSVAEKIANAVPVPTLFVPVDRPGFVEPNSGALLLRRILMPVSRDVPASHALDELLFLARGLGLSPGAIDLIQIGEGEQRLGGSDSRDRMHVRRLPEGPIVETILDASAEADLIAMPTRGHDSLMDHLRGSTTERVMRRASCPLMAIPA